MLKKIIVTSISFFIVLSSPFAYRNYVLASNTLSENLISESYQLARDDFVTTLYSDYQNSRVLSGENINNYTNIVNALYQSSLDIIEYSAESLTSNSDDLFSQQEIDALNCMKNNYIVEAGNIKNDLYDLIVPAVSDKKFSNSEYHNILHAIYNFDELVDLVNYFSKTDVDLFKMIFQINNLSESEKKILKIYIDCAISDQNRNIENNNYCPLILADLSSLSLKELQQLRYFLPGTKRGGNLRYCNRNPSDIYTDYIAWLSLFNANDVPDPTSDLSVFSGNGLSERNIFIKDLSITFDPDQQIAQGISFSFLLGSSISNLSNEKILHTLSLFAAVEYGQPLHEGKNESEKVQLIVSKIYRELECIF